MAPFPRPGLAAEENAQLEKCVHKRSVEVTYFHTSGSAADGIQCRLIFTDGKPEYNKEQGVCRKIGPWAAQREARHAAVLGRAEPCLGRHSHLTSRRLPLGWQR